MPLLGREGAGLVTGVPRARFAGLRKSQYAQSLRPFGIKGHQLQIAGATDHQALARLGRHALDRIVDPQTGRPAMNGRAISGLLDLPPAYIGRQAGLSHLSQGCQSSFIQRFCHLRTLHGQPTRGVLGIGRIERYSPDVRALKQLLENILEMHQADATVEIGAQIPGFQAAAHRRHR
ncbi:hypothetical protein D3C77_500490 [compost metagenome]